MNLLIKGFDDSLHCKLKVVAAQRQVTLKKLIESLLSRTLKKKRGEN